MAQRCSLCAHVRRAEADAALRKAHNVSELSRELGVSRQAILRHRTSHLAPDHARVAPQEPTPLRPRPKTDPQTAFLTSYAASGDLRQALKDGDIARAQLRKWQEHDEAFALRFHQAEAEAVEHLEAEARIRAVAGSKMTRRVYRQGLLYEEIHEWRPSDAMLVKLLQAHKPEKYSDKLTVTQTTVVKALDKEAWDQV